MEPDKKEPGIAIAELPEIDTGKKGMRKRLVAGIAIALIVAISAASYFVFWKPQPHSPQLAPDELAQLKYDSEKHKQDQQKAGQIHDEAFLLRKEDNNQAELNNLLKDLNMDKKSVPGSLAPVQERQARAEEEAISHILRNSNAQRVPPELYRKPPALPAPPERRTAPVVAQPAAADSINLSASQMFVYSRSYGGAKYVEGQHKNADAPVKMSTASIPAIDTLAKTAVTPISAIDMPARIASFKKQDQPNEQSAGERAQLVYNDNPPVTLYEGEMLDAVLVNRLITDTEPSPVITQLARDVFDSSTRYVVLPAGTHILGTSQAVSYKGAHRLFITFNRILLPNGVSLDLPASRKTLQALDQTGALGIVSKVDRHWFMQFGTALLFGVLDGISAAAQRGQDTDSTRSIILSSTSENFDRVLEKIMSQYSSIVPTIRVDQGKTLKICLSDDIVISPYAKVTDRNYYAKH
jgi:type IV secretory pathway VirB10-like protein